MIGFTKEFNWPRSPLPRPLHGSWEEYICPGSNPPSLQRCLATSPRIPGQRILSRICFQLKLDILSEIWHIIGFLLELWLPRRILWFLSFLQIRENVPWCGLFLPALTKIFFQGGDCPPGITRGEKGLTWRTSPLINGFGLPPFKGHLYSCFCFSFYFHFLSTRQKRGCTVLLGTLHIFSLLVESTAGL